MAVDRIRSTSLKRIGILTGGGDCPGLNAVIRSVAKPAMRFLKAEIVGILDGFEGLVEGRMRELTPLDVSGIVNLGGTILGTSNKGDPFHYPIGTPEASRSRTAPAKRSTITANGSLMRSSRSGATAR